MVSSMVLQRGPLIKVVGLDFSRGGGGNFPERGKTAWSGKDELFFVAPKTRTKFFAIFAAFHGQFMRAPKARAKSFVYIAWKQHRHRFQIRGGGATAPMVS